MLNNLKKTAFSCRLRSLTRKVSYKPNMTDKKDRTQPSEETYKAAGVDIEAGNELVRRIAPLAKATSRPGADADLGGFGGLFDLAACHYKDPVLVAANDGVGTKLKVAIESGIHNTVGIDLVAMSVNDLVVQGAEPLFFLDYFASGHLDVEVATQVIAGISEGCKQAGCALIGGETAEMPGMYADGDYDLAGFAVGAVERDAVLPRKDIQSGDVIIGLASSGPHSNGYSLIRRLVAQQNLDWSSLDPTGSHNTLAEALLTPTKVYVKPLLATINTVKNVKGLVHITGGGFQENLPRILTPELSAHIDLQTWEMPPIFDWLQRAGNMVMTEMLRTFNCGIGMTVVVAPADVDKVISSLTEKGETCFAIGHITERSTEAVTFSGLQTD